MQVHLQLSITFIAFVTFHIEMRYVNSNMITCMEYLMYYAAEKNLKSSFALYSHALAHDIVQVKISKNNSIKCFLV